MNYTDLIGGEVVFGRIRHNGEHNTDLETLGKLKLAPDGHIKGGGHDNEARWEVKDDQLLFTNSYGLPTTIFDTHETVAGANLLTGLCVIMPPEKPVRHFLFAYMPLSDDVSNMKVVVPTASRYGVPLTHCLAQLKAARVPPAMTWVTVAASGKSERINREGIEYSYMHENAYEYTGLIDVARQDLDCEYVFLLHDTCQVGPAFLDLVRQQPKTVPFDYMSVSAGNVHNIGIYRYGFLKEIRPFLESLNGISKRDGIAVEHNRNGRGFKGRARVSTNFLNGSRHPTGKHTPYGSSNARNGMHMPGADLHKFYFHFAGQHPEAP